MAGDFWQDVDWLEIRIPFIAPPCFSEVYESRNPSLVDKDAIAGSGSQYFRYVMLKIRA